MVKRTAPKQKKLTPNTFLSLSHIQKSCFFRALMALSRPSFYLPPDTFSCVFSINHLAFNQMAISFLCITPCSQANSKTSRFRSLLSWRQFVFHHFDAHIETTNLSKGFLNKINSGQGNTLTTMYLYIYTLLPVFISRF